MTLRNMSACPPVSRSWSEEKLVIMWEFASPSAWQATLSIAALMAVVYTGFHVAIRLRPTISKPDTSDAALAENFEEMRLEGDIDEAELRKIKAVLGRIQKSRAEALTGDGRPAGE
jgi:hypothetical protein